MIHSKLTTVAVAVSLTLGLSHCGGSSNDEELAEIDVPFSLGISDAFVDDAMHVVITIDEIRLIPVNDSDDDDDDDDDSDDDDSRETIIIDSFSGGETVSIDLLQYTGSDQLTVISEDDDIEVPLGAYRMELVVVDESSYVVLKNDANNCDVGDDISFAEGPGCYDIKVPSSRLRLGSFDVVLGASETASGPAYTVEFDLTQSLVLRGNEPAKNGFIIKPHGVRITGSTSSGHIEGDVDLAAILALSTDLDPLCTGDVHTVYLYQGDQSENAENLVDNYDPDDVDFDDSLMPVPANAVAPFASTLVVMDDDDDDDDEQDSEYEYEFGFVPNGDSFDEQVDPEDAIYTVVFACNVGDLSLKDNPVQYDGLVIPNPKEQMAVVEVITGEEVEQDFPVGEKDDDD
ncbi:DUF4382 domain-containing protein [Thalassotalea crassostreae]|uniref:DUF4382 domain-containing protein n=1 Tax=Thalassotalea crassostreae TaxID=1763536 RepID=UPI000837C025|nr:DUF4382 domain-containing protein [Thalassotalea crassostreae]